jgi:hypothetical protein
VENTKSTAGVEKRMTSFEVFEIQGAQVVRKVSLKDVNATQTSNLTIATPSVNSTLSASSHPSIEHRRPLPKVEPEERFKNRIHSQIGSSHVPPPRSTSNVAPDVAEKFGYCGELADSNTIPKLIRENALWPGAPFYAGGPAVVVGRTQVEPASDVSNFFNGKTEPANQPSVRQEPFDPFAKEPEKSLKQMRDKYPTVLESHDYMALKHLLSSRPNCFCGRPCAKFDGIVPV